jgi:hypothetical protein
VRRLQPRKISHHLARCARGTAVAETSFSNLPSNSKGITTADEMYGELINIKR